MYIQRMRKKKEEGVFDIVYKRVAAQEKLSEGAIESNESQT